MKSYIKSEITITAKQSAGARAHVQKQISEAALRVWGEDVDGLDWEFYKAFDKALATLDIEFSTLASVPEFDRGRLIVADAEAQELEALQDAIWRKAVSEGRSLRAAVDELFDASLAFLGIKVAGAARERRTVRKLRAA